jgi:hypothetical protein
MSSLVGRPERVGLLAPWSRLGPVLATTLYVCATAVWVADRIGLRGLACIVASLVLAVSAARRERRASRVAGWGFAIVVASLASGTPNRWLDAMGALGAGACALAARWALAHVVSTPGLATRTARSPRIEMLLLGIAWVLPLASALESPRAAPLARDDAAWATGVAGLTLVLLLVTGWIEMERRTLEMGVASRLGGAMGLVATAALLAAGLGYTRTEPAENIGRMAVALSSAAVVWLALHADGVAVAKASRRTLVLAFVGGAIAIVGGSMAGGRVGDAGFIAMATAIVTLVIGAVAPWLEEPLRPERGVLLDAIAAAHAKLLHDEPDEALREVLVALRAAGGPQSTSPEIWTFSPTRVATVDAAGYLSDKEAEIVDGIVAVASLEPEAAVRTDVLESLLVRRADLRAIYRWLEVRGALSATIVTRAGEVEGLLVLPQANRELPLSLEEARALKELADALAAACFARSAAHRARDREHGLILRADAAEEATERLRHELDLHVGRHALAAGRLARPAAVGIYSATSRLALEAIERRAGASAPTALVAPSGVDAVPYLARAHLSGPRATSPFVLVDCTQAREHDVERWSDARSSPLALADGGALVLLDVGALPLDVQRLVARALSERRPPWEQATPLDVALAVTAVVSPDALVEAGRMEENLANRLGDARTDPIVLPRLRDRPEDMRAIVTDRLAREGMRTRGEPVGIEPAAYALIVEHAFDGEEPELQSIAQRLVAASRGDVVRVSDVVDVLKLAVPEPAPVVVVKSTRSTRPPRGRKQGA